MIDLYERNHIGKNVIKNVYYIENLVDILTGKVKNVYDRISI